MAAISGTERTPVAGSGGKIVTRRWRRASATPYDRPRQPPPPQESPNWLTRATRMIASGAVKMITSAFDSSSSSSSEDEGEEEDELQNEIDITDEGQCDQTDGVNNPNKEWTSSEGRNFANKDARLSLLNSVPKSAIVRLIMQESFSRQERDRLVQIIDSRVMDQVIAKEADCGLLENSVGNARYDSTEPVMEARKYVEETKVGSIPSPDLACELSTAALQHFESVTGSPVDVAKSYIRSRPPWASHLAAELRTPFALTRELFKEGTCTSFDGGLSSSSKKRNAFASGAWNIEEELRRVRSKASEDMLSSLPSTNADLSSFRRTPKFGKSVVLADLQVCEVEAVKVNTTAARPVDASDVEVRKDDLGNESTSAHALLEFQNNDVEAVKVTADNKSEASANLDVGVQPCDDPRSTQKNVPQVDGFKEAETAGNVNGLHTSQARSSHGEIRDVNLKPDDNSGPVGIHRVNDVCSFLTEASVEVPIVDETNGIGDASQHISSMPRDDLDEGMTYSDTDKNMIEANSEVTLNLGARRASRYARKAKARGRQS